MVLRLTLALLLAASLPALADERLALFDFEIINTSLEATTPIERERLQAITAQARAALAAHGLTSIDVTPASPAIAKLSSLRDCNGCELGLARELGAEVAAIGWVQKVSNLILNINLQLRDVATGRLLKAGSVDIRGNTDESWRRGIAYLINRRLYPSG